MVKQFALASVLIASVAHAADYKAAFVDIQRALQETDEGKAAKARLQALADSKQKAVEKEKAAIQADVESFQRQASTMDDKVRVGKEQELQKRTYDFAQKADKLRLELAESERKELGSIVPKLEQILGQIAQRDGLSMVYEKSALAWAPTSLDITNELIRIYNTQAKAPKPAAK